ncbi:hypothetical protein AKJ16_DCAP18666 [Drosera capensis]
MERSSEADKKKKNTGSDWWFGLLTNSRLRHRFTHRLVTPQRVQPPLIFRFRLLILFPFLGWADFAELCFIQT